MGIEPTSPGWEPGALPLSYTRSTFGDCLHFPPEGDLSSPLRGVDYGVCLATGHHAEVCVLSDGAIVSAPIRPVTGRPSLSPHSSTRYAIESPCGHSSPDPVGQRVGLTTFRMSDTVYEGSIFSPVVLMPACPDQATGQPTTSLLGQACQTLWPVQLYDDSNNGSLTLTLQTSLAPHRRRLPVTCSALTGIAYPRGRLHCQSA